MSFNRLFPDDEELGKKDDDFRPDQHTLAGDIRQSASPSSLLGWFTSPRLRRRRLALLFALLVCAYVFIKNIPTDLRPVGEMVDIRDPTRTIRGVPVVNQAPLRDGDPVKNAAKDKDASATLPKPNPPMFTPKALRTDEIPAVLRGGEKTTDHYYDGLLRFYDLPGSLHGITHTNGYKEANKNVLFLAATTKSASRLIPLACEMANFNRNHVHFAFVGRDSITLDTLKEVNGVGRECSVYWHDGRPDGSDISTDGRMEYAVTSALYHIQTYMHPQVYFTDSLEEEERWFGRAIRAHTARAGKSLIDLPVDAIERMMWITRLDHASLAAWDTVYIDILIHVPPKTSGSLIRLLKTIQSADYFGIRYPHLTIELPPKIEPTTQRFLDNFVWPPLPKAGGKHTSQLTLRRRIPREHLSPMESSVRTIESFYSARPHQSHVLVLSTQAELSSLYYHYLFYNTLEYGYSSYFTNTPEQEALMGIALDLPVFKLNGEDTLNPPAESDATKPFYWQAPDTHAALYFGNKWQELHDFLGRRLTSVHKPTEKLVSPTLPAFAEPMLELMRARCWFLLYPHLPDGRTIATIHNELSAAPEEYQPPEPEKADHATPPSITKDTPYLEPVDLPPIIQSHPEDPLLEGQLVNILPQEGDLPDLSSLPVLTWDAQRVGLGEAIGAAGIFAAEFHKTIGGCTGKYTGVRYVDTVDDLFCEKPAEIPPADQASEPSTAQDPPPVRAGLEAAIAAQGTKVPNALRLDPDIKSGKPSSGNADVDDSITAQDLADSGLVFDTSKPPPKPVGGGSALRDEPSKDSAGPADAKTVEAAVSTWEDQIAKANHVNADTEAAMKAEFKAHLDRLQKDPAKMQKNLEQKLKLDEAARRVSSQRAKDKDVAV